MADSETKVTELIDTIYDYLIGMDDSHLTPFITCWPSKPFKTRTVSTNSLPVLTYLPELIAGANAETERVVKLLKTSADSLGWGQTYSTEDFDTNFLMKYGWTELIGLRGPVSSQDIACGFLLLGPEIEYPKHSHEAKEVYVPLSSQSLWIQGNEGWVSRSCGVPIYHRSWQPHGMRTESTPLLSLYIWRGGNLVQKSHIGE
jgi:Dimethlysulfonioproprionate lyase